MNYNEILSLRTALVTLLVLLVQFIFGLGIDFLLFSIMVAILLIGINKLGEKPPSKDVEGLYNKLEKKTDSKTRKKIQTNLQLISDKIRSLWNKIPG